MPVSKKNLIFSFLVLLSTFTNDGGGGSGSGGGVECSIHYKRKKIVYHGDIMIGALLPVHEQPSHTTDTAYESGSLGGHSQQHSSIVAQSARRICGVIRDQYGVQRVEALLYTLDKINNKNLSRILPGIRLGLEIRDECWDSSIALEETIDFIKDTIAIDNDEPDDDNQNQNNGSMVIINQNGAYSSKDTNKDMDLHEKCQAISKEKKEKKKIFAVIGPGASSVSINVQNLLQLFDIPQIGYSATSRDLSDKKMYKTFLRVVPSDYLQVRAMLDLVIAMNWTYIFAIYTEGSYGQTGMEAFRNETSYLDICLAMYEKIREYAVDEDYDKIIKKMNTTSSARVIVCFCYGETIRGLLGAINRFGLKGRFLIVGSDGWSDRIDVAKDYYQEAVGSFSIKAYSPKVTEFDDYFMNLNPTNNPRNIWFKEYWEERFDCYIDEATKARFKTSCKRKCPADFVEIGNNCYYFSRQDANWIEARAECRSKYDNSDLLDLNSPEDLNDVLEYAASQAMTDHLLRMHVRIKISSPVPSSAASTSNANDEIISTSGIKTSSNEEQTLKLVHCPTKYRTKSAQRQGQAKGNEDIYDDEIDMEDMDAESSNDEGYQQHRSMANESSVSDFLSSLSDPDVITFFNLRLKPDVQCISVHISNTMTPKASGNNFSYCAQFKVCYTRLPYVCKLSPPSPANRSAAALQRQEFYPDTLRNYQQDPKMSYVINSLLAIAHGLNRVHQKFCHGHTGLCEKMKNLNGSELLTSIKASSFSGITGENIYFDPNGDPPGRYVILNVQREENGDNLTKYIYREVGNWNNDKRLTLNLDQIKFPNSYKSYRSVCSEGCDFGYVKQIQGGVKCCWNCKKCEEHAFIANEYTCKDCEYGYWPNKNLTGCDKLPLTYLKWNEPAAIVALFVSCVGMLVNTFITYVFVTFSNTCVVKSTTKELSYIILTGIYICYLMTWPLIMKPNEITCYLYRILPGFSLSLIYGALITKTNRIARILARSKKRIITKKPRFMSLTAQIIITLSIITIEVMLIVAAFVFEPGNVIVDDRTRRYEARLMCANKEWSIIGPIGYNMCLVAMCTFYAVRTRNLPENFNEAKFIGFSMYTTCVIWLAFIPLFFGSDFKVITLCLSTSFSATVILIFLFIPKVYIIIFEPEKNQRSAFATAKEIRCHFGSNVQTSSIDDRSKMGNGFALLDKLGLKPAEPKTSVKRSNSQRSKSANTRFAYRPRSIHGDPRLANMTDKSMDSFDTYTSIYQISDRSCQTSLELLEPFVDRAIKRRKLVAQEAAMAMSFSEGELNKLSDDGGGAAALAVDLERLERHRKSSKMAEMLELEAGEPGGPPTGLGALGNLLLFPLIATHHPQMGPNAQAASSVQTQDTSNNEDEDMTRTKSWKKKNNNNNNNEHNETESGMTTADEASASEFMRSKRFGKRMSQGAFELIEPFSKVFNKARNLRMSMRLGRRMSQQTDQEDAPKTAADLKDALKTTVTFSKTSDASTLTDSSSSSANESLKSLRNPIKGRTTLRFTKTKNVLNQIAENSVDKESNENNSPSGTASLRKPSSESIRSENGATVVARGAEKCEPVNEEEGATTDSVTSLNKITAATACSSNQQSGRRIVLPPPPPPTSDCDSEFTIKMELEDKSLEDFNRVINQNKNLVLNWDYVQSSDYL